MRARVIPTRDVGGHQYISQSMCACGHPKTGRGSTGPGLVPRVGAEGKQALAADKSPESGDDFTEVSRSRSTAVQRSLMARIDCEKILVRRVSDNGAFESPSLSTH